MPRYKLVKDAEKHIVFDTDKNIPLCTTKDYLVAVEICGKMNKHYSDKN